MTLNFRVYDDGIAVQYQMPEGSVTISGDDTRFALPTDARHSSSMATMPTAARAMRASAICRV